MTTKFEVGKTYATRSICDHYRFKILGRTAKQVTFDDGGATKRRGIFIHNGVECFMPFGRYSMAPTISANEESAL